jgi:hypothetical protein
MGDIDGAVERNGHILWMEWKRGAIVEMFDRQFSAQVRQAQAFTRNSPRQCFIFVLGCPVEMRVDAFRLMRGGEWARDWEYTGTDGLKTLLRRWYSYAEKVGACA